MKPACPGRLLLLLALLAGGARAQQSQDALRIDTTIVSVPVTVLDRSGRFVAGLQRGDFRLFENGVEQQIEFFVPSEERVTIALLIDVSDSTESKFTTIKEAAVTFIDQLRPQDQVMLMTFDSNISLLSEPTTDHQRIRRIIQGILSGGGTRLYDAVEQALPPLRNVRGRKAIVLFTDGVDTGSDATAARNARAVEESEVFVYSIQYIAAETAARIADAAPNPMAINTGAFRGDAGKAAAYLRQLAETSGGRFYLGDSPKNLAKSFASIAEELRNQYSLGYYPNATARPGERRKLRILCNRPQVVIRARKSYIYVK